MSNRCPRALLAHADFWLKLLGGFRRIELVTSRVNLAVRVLPNLGELDQSPALFAL